MNFTGILHVWHEDVERRRTRCKAHWMQGAKSGWVPDRTVPWVSIGRVGGVSEDAATSACSSLSVRSFSVMFVSPPRIGTPGSGGGGISCYRLMASPPSKQLSWSDLPDLSQMKRQPREV